MSNDDPLTMLAVRVERTGPLGVGLLVAAAGWILDQATKAAALRGLRATVVADGPGPFFFRVTTNAGAAFGIPAPWWLFFVVTAVVVVLVYRNLPESHSALEPFAYGLLLAGALGNITDRMLRPHPEGFGRGEVVDFIATSFNFPTFNVADMCITGGFALLVLAAGLHGAEPRRDPPTPARHRGSP